MYITSFLSVYILKKEQWSFQRLSVYISCKHCSGPMVFTKIVSTLGDFHDHIDAFRFRFRSAKPISWAAHGIRLAGFQAKWDPLETQMQFHSNMKLCMYTFQFDTYPCGPVNWPQCTHILLLWRIMSEEPMCPQGQRPPLRKGANAPVQWLTLEHLSLGLLSQPPCEEVQGCTGSVPTDLKICLAYLLTKGTLQ